ncbi:hypothetical protein DL767_008951 [Monosporascus sp. MG133]|nr:hypothetical protein DL767_008951 [Monosporascus sp. MG133]
MSPAVRWGFNALIESRVLMIQRRDDEALSLHGYDEDPLKELGKHPKEKHKLADECLRRSGRSSWATLLVAWWTRLAISHIPAGSEQTIMVQNVYLLRKVLQRDPAAGEAMWSATKEQGNREQIEAYQAAVMEGIYLLPDFLGSYSNWTQADLFSRNSRRRLSSHSTPPAILPMSNNRSLGCGSSRGSSLWERML